MGKFLDASPELLQNAIYKNLKSLRSASYSKNSDNEADSYDICHFADPTTQTSPVSTTFDPSGTSKINVTLKTDATPLNLNQIDTTPLNLDQILESLDQEEGDKKEQNKRPTFRRLILLKGFGCES
eukprot:CAMPEP_0194267266 /NCGR_PEP_ID=MMETSP0169-20130528/1844_1 /TAXON_ID=218684 /ORGANISM="Corethron pennatum, Strain L29A3" /LENGTH=125 /DNA_ID=CAMNT_0039008085 /DNA_START=225 /DNA_END=603 /DNA_ORIENTATION=+